MRFHMTYFKKVVCLFLVIIAAGCNRGHNLAPVSDIRWQPFSKNQSSHVVRRGETLYAISFRYDTDYRQLARLNHLRPPYSLRVGQVLNVRGLGRQQRAIYHPATPAKNYHPAPIKQRPIYSAPIRSRSSSGWMWPVSGRVVTGFIPSQGKKGINIASNKGERVRASADGVVAYAGSGLLGYGNLIIIKHNNEFLTAYGNNSRNMVSEGQRVKAGQVIAEVGIIDHKYFGVHFEIRKVGVPVNPLNYLQKG